MTLTDDLIRNMVKYINDISVSDEKFVFHFNRVFKQKDIYTILGINRNRYNYLVRTEKLDQEILKLRKDDSNE